MIRTSWIDPETNKEYGYNWGGFGERKTVAETVYEMMFKHHKSDDENEKENEEKMKMDEMNKWLKDRGFSVGRSYDKIQHNYVFTIRKDGHTYSERFTYSNPWTQKTWLENFVANFERYCLKKSEPKGLLPNIKNVIFSDPATIVIWEDGTKTVVKCMDGDVYSEETGLAMAICKKVYGNNNFFHKVFKKWVVVEKPLNILIDEGVMDKLTFAALLGITDDHAEDKDE